MFIGPDKHFFECKIVIISLAVNMCCRYSKEPSYKDGYYEYPKHMVSLSKKSLIPNYTSVWRPQLLLEICLCHMLITTVPVRPSLHAI